MRGSRAAAALVDGAAAIGVKPIAADLFIGDFIAAAAFVSGASIGAGLVEISGVVGVAVLDTWRTIFTAVIDGATAGIIEAIAAGFLGVGGGLSLAGPPGSVGLAIAGSPVTDSHSQGSGRPGIAGLSDSAKLLAIFRNFTGAGISETAAFAIGTIYGIIRRGSGSAVDTISKLIDEPIAIIGRLRRGTISAGRGVFSVAFVFPFSLYAALKSGDALGVYREIIGVAGTGTELKLPGPAIAIIIGDRVTLIDKLTVAIRVSVSIGSAVAVGFTVTVAVAALICFRGGDLFGTPDENQPKGQYDSEKQAR